MQGVVDLLIANLFIFSFARPLFSKSKQPTTGETPPPLHHTHVFPNMPCPVRTHDVGEDIRSADRPRIRRLRRQHARIARFAADRIPADVGWLEPFKLALEKLELRAYWQRSNAVARGELTAPDTMLPGRVYEVLSAFLEGRVPGGRTCSMLATMFGQEFPGTFRRRLDRWGHRWRQFLRAQAHLRRVGRSPATDALNVWLRSSRPANTTTPAERERLAGLLRGVLSERGAAGGEGDRLSGVAATLSQPRGGGVASGASSGASSTASSGTSTPSLEMASGASSPVVSAASSPGPEAPSDFDV